MGFELPSCRPDCARPSHRSTGWLLAAVTVVLAGLAFAPRAWAQTAAASPADPAARPLSVAELVACIGAEESLGERRRALEAASAQHDLDLKSLTPEAQAIAQAQQTTRAADKAAQQALVQRAEAYDRRIDALNAVAARLNQQGTALQQEISRYNLDCAARPFAAADRDRALAEHRRGKEVAAPGPATTGQKKPGEFESGVTAYDQGRFEEALRLWLPLAEQGRVAAQFNVASLYQQGQGVARDDRQAARWFLAAAKQGDAAAQFQVASLYEAGTGVEKDPAQAAAWYAAAAGNAAADRATVDAATKARDRLAVAVPAKASDQVIVAFQGGRYVIQRSAASACVVALQGAISRDTSLSFGAAVDKARSLGCAQPLTLLLESPGGSHFDGITLGREIRDAGMTTVARYECASACASAFLGGARRVLWGSRAAIGLHQIANVRLDQKFEDRQCVVDRNDPGMLELRRYLSFVVPDSADRIRKLIAETPCKSITWVSGQGALDLGVATRLEASGVDTFGPREARHEDQR